MYVLPPRSEGEVREMPERKVQPKDTSAKAKKSTAKKAATRETKSRFGQARSTRETKSRGM
jgi:hypothetical protein